MNGWKAALFNLSISLILPSAIKKVSEIKRGYLMFKSRLYAEKDFLHVQEVT